MKLGVLILVALLLVCQIARANETEPPMNAEPYTTIAKKNVGQAELKEAINKLGLPVNESGHFWSQIANDQQYSNFHRKSAVFQLFRRHVRAGMNLSEFAHLLERPIWLRPEDVQLVDVLDGKIPVDLVAQDTVFVIKVLPQSGKEVSSIYLRIHGKVSKKSLLSLIWDGDQGDIDDMNIVQIGYSDFK